MNYKSPTYLSNAEFVFIKIALPKSPLFAPFQIIKKKKAPQPPWWRAYGQKITDKTDLHDKYHINTNIKFKGNMELTQEN